MSEESETGVFVFNPLPWERELRGPVAEHVLDPRGEPGDPTAGRHFQDRDKERGLPAAFADGTDDPMAPSGTVLPPTSVPGYGYALVSSDDLVEVDPVTFSERATVETDAYALRFDRDRGGIASLRDRQLGRELVDTTADWPLAGFVHEQVADTEHPSPRQLLFDFADVDWGVAAAGLPGAESGFNPDWRAERRGPERVRRHRVYETPLGYDVRQRLAVPHLESDVSLRVLVPDGRRPIVVEATWAMSQRTHPEATYLAFPFDVPDPTPRIDVGGTPVRPGADQLPGGCYDYYTTQHWVDVSGADAGVTVGTPLNPVVQFGDFHFGEVQSSFDPADGHLYGWVTNNYWDTNFRASQPGRVRARYHLSPHDGFDETRAHRVGRDAAHWEPAAQTLAEPPAADVGFAARGQLLDLPEPPVLVLQVRSAGTDDGIFHPGGPTVDDRILLVLRNASDESATATVQSTELAVTDAERTDPYGSSTAETLAVADGTVDVELGGRETVGLLLSATA